MNFWHPKKRRDTALPCDILPYFEVIAESVHDCWAEGRLADGWTYGEKYDQDKKLHPCLIPYNQLPESEKDYDRRTAQCTIQALLEAGFTITAPNKPKEEGRS